MSKRRKGQDLFSKEAVKLRLTNQVSARNEIKSIANRESAVLFNFSSLNETGSAIMQYTLQYGGWLCPYEL